MVVGIVRLHLLVVFNLEANLQFDPTRPTPRVELKDFPPERLVEVPRRGQQLTFKEHRRLLPHHNGNLTQGAREGVCVLRENQEGERLARLKSLGGVRDELRLAFSEKAEEILETVMRLSVEKEGKPPRYVLKTDQ
jgi:hypothetical protein